MPGSFKTEAIVLRSIRYGEADRVLHLYTPAADRAQALAFRLKLLLAAGFAPELASCAGCGEAEHLGAFSPSAGGVVCAGCEAGSFPLGEEAHRFLVGALSRSLAETPEAPEPALSQADRAIAETAEYHAHVRLRRVA